MILVRTFYRRLQIGPLTTYIMEPSLLPLGSIHCWSRLGMATKPVPMGTRPNQPRFDGFSLI